MLFLDDIRLHFLGGYGFYYSILLIIGGWLLEDVCSSLWSVVRTKQFRYPPTLLTNSVSSELRAPQISQFWKSMISKTTKTMQSPGT